MVKFGKGLQQYPDQVDKLNEFSFYKWTHSKLRLSSTSKSISVAKSTGTSWSPLAKWSSIFSHSSRFVEKTEWTFTIFSQTRADLWTIACHAASKFDVSSTLSYVYLEVFERSDDTSECQIIHRRVSVDWSSLWTAFRTSWLSFHLSGDVKMTFPQKTIRRGWIPLRHPSIQAKYSEKVQYKKKFLFSRLNRHTHVAQIE